MVEDEWPREIHVFISLQSPPSGHTDTLRHHQWASLHLHPPSRYPLSRFLLLLPPHLCRCPSAHSWEWCGQGPPQWERHPRPGARRSSRRSTWTSWRQNAGAGTRYPALQWRHVGEEKCKNFLSKQCEGCDQASLTSVRYHCLHILPLRADVSGTATKELFSKEELRCLLSWERGGTERPKSCLLNSAVALTMFLVQELYFLQHILSHLGKARASLLTAAQDQAVLVVPSADPVERLTQSLPKTQRHVRDSHSSACTQSAYQSGLTMALWVITDLSGTWELLSGSRRNTELCQKLVVSGATLKAKHTNHGKASRLSKYKRTGTFQPSMERWHDFLPGLARQALRTSLYQAHKNSALLCKVFPVWIA